MRSVLRPSSVSLCIYETRTLLQKDFCRGALVYLSRSRYGRIRMRIARPHNAFTAENLRYEGYMGERKIRMRTRTRSFTRQRCTIVLGRTAQLASVSA